MNEHTGHIPLGLVGYIAIVITSNIGQWPIQRLSQVQGVT